MWPTWRAAWCRRWSDLCFEFAAGAFLHEKRYEVADPAGFEPGMLFADEGVDNHGRDVGKFVNQSSLDIR